MGILTPADGDDWITLRARHLVGRSRACDLRLSHRSVSGEHAVLLWHEDRWWVRDLGSRNGVQIDGERIPVGEPRPLDRDGLVSFGAEAFRLVSDLAPVARAVRLGEVDEVRTAEDGQLVLPDAEHPVVWLLQRMNGTWIAEQDEETREVADLDVLDVDGTLWRLQLPEDILRTTERVGLDGGFELPPSLADARMDFRVSADEEHVEVSLVEGAGRLELKPLAHWYTILTLARERLENVEDPDGGWVDRELLCRMLRLDRNALNVQLYRARKQLASEGVGDVERLLERRPGKIRFGITRATVESLSD